MLRDSDDSPSMWHIIAVWVQEYAIQVCMPCLGQNPLYEMKEKRYMSRSELAEMFGVKVRTVSGWVKEGCPVIYTGAVQEPGRGSRPLFIGLDVEAWLKARRGGYVNTTNRQAGKEATA